MKRKKFMTDYTWFLFPYFHPYHNHSFFFFFFFFSDFSGAFSSSFSCSFSSYFSSSLISTYGVKSGSSPFLGTHSTTNLRIEFYYFSSSSSASPPYYYSPSSSSLSKTYSIAKISPIWRLIWWQRSRAWEIPLSIAIYYASA